MTPEEKSRWIKSEARKAGYDEIRVSPVELPLLEQERLADFLDREEFGEMTWMKNYREIRLSPGKILPGSRSALVLLKNYFDSHYDDFLEDRPVRISRYAPGRDYHRILRKKGARLLETIRQKIPDTEGRVVCDSAPVPEKILGKIAGAGWIGKNTNLIHPELGSYFFISILFLNLDLPFDPPITERCGSCDLCERVCPAAALTGGRLEAIRCISYQTIEKHTPPTPAEMESFDGWIFGCDLCQEVCPWNRKLKKKGIRAPEEFQADPGILEFLKSPFTLNEQQWEELTRGKVLKRSQRENWNQFIKVVQERRNHDC